MFLAFSDPFTSRQRRWIGREISRILALYMTVRFTTLQYVTQDISDVVIPPGWCLGWVPSYILSSKKRCDGEHTNQKSKEYSIYERTFVSLMVLQLVFCLEYTLLYVKQLNTWLIYFLNSRSISSLSWINAISASRMFTWSLLSWNCRSPIIQV